MDMKENINDKLEEEKDNNEIPYMSQRLIIKGLHLYFIDIAREIVQHNCIQKIPLMREYHLSESELNEIIQDVKTAKIIDKNCNITMNANEFEKFIDIYEPSIFDCKNSVFDKEIFMCMGEIIFDKGVEDTYDSLSADEVVDYLSIMEKLKIIEYDDIQNKFHIITERTEFERICKCIPQFFCSVAYEDSEVDDINDFDSMSGIEFEKYCAHILLKNSFKDIRITPPSGDHGIDILAEKENVSYAIQCKCYSNNIGNAAIQQAHTGRCLYHKDIAVVMTNQYFTAQAIEEAEVLGVKLWDRNKLSDMI